MGRGKKVFIDRKKAVSFHLVHRSQHDPLVTDEAAPQRVLLETKTSKNDQQKQTDNDELTPEKRREEQRKYGIHFDDEYNYLQHLKKPDQEIVWEYVENPNQTRKRLDEGKTSKEPKLNLPSSVFASNFEEDIGMLNKAAPHPGPRPDWDPDVVAALDDDFDFDNENNELEDDFVVKAMEGGDDDDDDDYNENKYEGSDYDEEEEKDFDSDNLNDSDDGDDMQEDPEIMDKLAPLMREQFYNRFANEETKSRFTEYSMSSSVTNRTDQLNLLDDRFEKFYASYDEEEVGDLSLNEIQGSWNQKHPYVLNCYKQFKKADNVESYNKNWDKERIEKYRNVVDGDVDPNEELVDLDVSEEKKWDCESILSTYSNIYNHPKLIEETSRRSRRNSKNNTTGVDKIEIDPKTGLPTNVLRGGDNQLTAKALAQLDKDNTKIMGPKSLCDKSVLSALTVLSIRPESETPEEKKERKRLLRDYRMERRIEKKANSNAFKEEKKRQVHIRINQRMNQQGNKVV